VLLGALIGLAVGLGAGALSGPEPLATARLQVLPDPSLTLERVSTSDPDRFTQGEVLVLGGDDLQASAGIDSRSSDGPEVTATQVGKTDVVQLDVRASSEAEAASATSALVRAYEQRREDGLAGQVSAAVAIVDRQIAALERAGGGRADVEYARLLGVRNQLQLLGEADQRQVVVLEQPSLVEQSRLNGAVRGALTGLVLGALLGLLTKLVLDRSTTRENGASTAWHW